ncbi:MULTISPECIES: cell wall metabolism sensor histidine kinase WalK [unclassified Paenibacillus]|uniref:sensor histidine kinase n=1 Tax=unclassified Paenibacillus TaxID=185978 RepID=UPI001C112207|nr:MULTISPECIES: HAMP domain-containing sensor histidine kinase [unclassified Paenibacillus]MBU5443629.1 HAMP domain-containing histidine kinase [Paenibacillus sp. MSJ-34]CAH0122720.1 Sensor histidine kinase RcsC [Paenibacillus sp. CECT 9249]
MKKGIVLKLFLLTTALCMFVLAIIFIGQTLFFKQFYVHQRMENVQAAIESYKQDYLNHAGDAQAAANLEQNFYQEHGTWITTLDAMGNLKYTGDFTMEIRLERSDDTVDLPGQTLTVPLYTVMNVEDMYTDNPFLAPWIQEGDPIAVEGIIVNNQPVVQRMGRSGARLREEGRLENSQMVNKEYEVVPRFESGFQYHEKYPTFLVKGTITKVRIPEGAAIGRYTNHLFLDRIKALQADLLYGDYDGGVNAGQVIDFEQNQVNYKMFVNRIEDPDGKPAYIVAMTSLQPVAEAAGVMQNYYVYIVVATLLLVLLVSFYFSRRIARPLLRINRTAQKMAGLDFSEKIPVTTKDEIGDLSRNINELSERLHSHIARLEEDIEKEKQLENTRKEFIAGVSHELKTPLSVIQSCLSILKDGVASHKRDYYFAAMEDEVRRMDLLIADMLELAKYESGTYKMELESFDIAAVLERMCAKFASEIASKELQLHTHLQPIEIVANGRRIEQVIVNFLTNAIRYTPEHGTIIVSTVEERDSVKVCIENKGAHIPDEQLEKIWDRFYRGEPSRQRATGGTGLGLAISRKILEMHGVPYGVTNTAEGVMFYFYLNKKG